MKRHRTALFVSLLLLASCGKPGATPAGQPALTTLAGPTAVVQRFNRAFPDQVQVVAMFSPT